MHEKLKFSFGHILAFLSLIFGGYVTFVGVTYYTGGDYIIGGAVAIGISLVLLFLLFRLQLLKSVNEKFESYIIHERITLVVFTLTCCGAFIPFSHFWTVKSHEEDILVKFEESLQFARQLFSDYDEYANERIHVLEEGKNDYNPRSAALERASYQAGLKGIQIQLLPDKYLNLEQEALEWVDQSEKTISIWNVFLMGNVNVINSSIRDWHDEMSNMSTHITDLELNHNKSKIDRKSIPSPFKRTEEIAQSSSELESVLLLYSTVELPKPLAWLTGILAILMLYLPWIIQKRSPKSMVTLWGVRSINYKDSHAQELKEKQKIDYVHKKSHLDEGERVQTGRRGQQLSPDSGHKHSTRRALTLDLPPENE